MKRFRIYFEEEQEVSNFMNAILAEKEWASVCDLFPKGAYTCVCAAKSEGMQDELLPTLKMCLDSCNIKPNDIVEL